MRLFYGVLLTLISVFSFSQNTLKKKSENTSSTKKQTSPNKLTISSNNIYKDKELLLLIPKKKEGKFGYVDQDGNVKISFEFSSATFFTEDCNLTNSSNPKIRKFGTKEYATVEKNNKKFRISKSGQLAYQFKDLELGKCKSTYQKKKFYAYILNGKYGLIEEATFENPGDYNQYKIYPQYDYLFVLESNDTSNPMIVATKDNRFGILDVNGKIIVPFEYSDIKRNYSYKEAGLFEVTKDDVNYFYIDVYNKAY